MNYKDYLNDAYINKYAIPQFNTNNLEFSKWILETCNEEKSPVILGVSEGAMKYMGGPNAVHMMVEGLIKDLDIKVPVFVHLDHGSSVLACQACHKANYESVMIDASSYDINKNIELTKEVISSCPGIVEAEIGAISTDSYASIDDAIKLTKEANVDMLAVACSNAHGLYKSEPNIQFDLIKEISYSTNIPLVLHGGTGLSDDVLKKCIENGICKINFNTELQVAWNNELRKFILDNESIYDPRKIIMSGKEAVKEVIRHKISILGSNNKVK